MQIQYIKLIKNNFTVCFFFICCFGYAQKDKDFISYKKAAEHFVKKKYFVLAIENYKNALSIDLSCTECKLAINSISVKLKERKASNSSIKPPNIVKSDDKPTIIKKAQTIIKPILPEMVSLFYKFQLDDSTLNSFLIGTKEVSQKEWKVFTDLTQREMPVIPLSLQNEEFPIINITWQEAKNYCEWLSEITKQKYDLPTKEEWLLARDKVNSLEGEAWIYENAKRSLHETGTKEKNTQGVYDLEGNAAEWVEDWYDKDLLMTDNLKEIFDENEDFKNRIVCGCSFKDEKYFCKTPFIRSFDNQIRKEFIGFRVVKRNY
jgi:formylglycine-generating enzyme